MPFERDPSEIGVLWIKSGAKGDWLSGTINGEPVIAFKNTAKKEGSKAPDWLVKRPQKKAPAPPAVPTHDEDEIGF